jgi:hypothetical protein
MRDLMTFARYTLFLIGVGVAASGAACAATVVSTPPNSEMTNGRASTLDRLTGDELRRASEDGSLMDALVRVRPFMLLSRGIHPPLVSIAGAPAADLSILNTLLASEVQEVRMLRSSSNFDQTVVAANGDIIHGDVIIVTLRGSRR